MILGDGRERDIHGIEAVGQRRGGCGGEGSARCRIERIVDDVVAVPIDLDDAALADGDVIRGGVVIGEIVGVVDARVAGGLEVDGDGGGPHLAEIEHDGDGAGVSVGRSEVGTSILVEIGSDDAPGSSIHTRVLPVRRTDEAAPVFAPKDDGFGAFAVEGDDGIHSLVAVEIADRHPVGRLGHGESVAVAEAVPLPEEQAQVAAALVGGQEAHDALPAVVVEVAGNDEPGVGADGVILAAAEAGKTPARLLRIQDGGGIVRDVGRDDVQPGVAVALERRYPFGSAAHVVGPAEHKALPIGGVVGHLEIHIVAFSVGVSDIQVLVAVEIGTDDVSRGVPGRRECPRIAKAYENAPFVLAQQDGDVMAEGVGGGDVQPSVLIEIADGDSPRAGPDAEIDRGLIAIEVAVVVD